MTISNILNVGALVLGCLSAYCWLRSSIASVRHPHAKHDGVYADGSVCIDGQDLLSTVKAQSRWNRAAAALAAMTVMCQVAVALSAYM